MVTVRKDQRERCETDVRILSFCLFVACYLFVSFGLAFKYKQVLVLGDEYKQVLVLGDEYSTVLYVC